MELLIEIIFELVFEGSLEIAKNKKVNKWIRYPIIIILVLFLSSIIFLISFVGIMAILNKESNSFYFGLILLFLDIILLVSGIIKIKKEVNLKHIQNLDQERKK